MKALVIALCCILSIGVAYGANPTGSMNYQHPHDVEYALGWAQDPDAPDQAIQVHFYMDDSTFIGSAIANLPYTGHGNHGFKFRVPYTCYDGGNHTIKGFGINVGSGNNTILANCPKTMHKAYALSTSSARVVVSLDCGGAITQIFHYNNFEDNMVLSHPGGAFQCDFRDSNFSGQNGQPVWNPTQASDLWQNYTGIIDWNYDSSTQTLYTRSQPIQWFPEQWGGAQNQPVHGDICLEQWAKLSDNVLYMKYRATNTTGIGREATFQEFPCIFLIGSYNTAVTTYNSNWVLQDYSGNSPDNPLLFYSTEYWFGACNSNNIGPNVILPHDDPYRGPNECNYSMFSAIDAPFDAPYGYMCPSTTFGIGNVVGATVTRNCPIFIGNYTEARSFALNTTPPTGSLSINSGSKYSTSASVNLTPTASGSGSIVADMKFANAGSGWTGWEAYTTNKAWTLTSGNGTKTVYVQYRDAMGNVSTIYRGSIIVDATPPTVPGTPVDAGAYTTNPSVTFSWTASTDSGGSGLVGYICAIGTTPGANDVFEGNVGNVLTKTISGTPGNRYYCRVQAVDGAGGMSAWSGDSDGISVVEQLCSDIGTAKGFPDSTSIGLAAESVTAIFGDCFYIEDINRSSGMRIVPAGGIPIGLAIGSRVDIGGRIMTNQNRERWIDATVSIN